jgi:signal peptidase I
MRILAALISALLLFCALSCSGQKAFTIPNTSMEPTLRKSEKFTVEMGPFQPSRGDLILFEHGGLTLVKRVIAIGGDTIEGRNNEVLLNGSALKEPYVQHTGPDSPLSTFGPQRVPVGKVFVAGDNRDYSLDSRTASFGLVAISDIKGKPVEIVDSDDPKRIHLLLSSHALQ